MTTYEHAMLGMNGTIACGLHEKYGWKIIAMAAIAATLPDLDGLTWFISNEAFSVGHRVWGHNLFACVLIGIAFGIADYQWDIVTRAGRWVKWLLRWKQIPEEALTIRQQRIARQQVVWVVIAAIAALSQLPADLVVSGTDTLPVWGLQLLWPLSDQEWSFQMVMYHDPGVILIFIAGMFAMVKWTQHLKWIARIALAAVVAYLLLRGFVWHDTPFGDV